MHFNRVSFILCELYPKKQIYQTGDKGANAMEGVAIHWQYEWMKGYISQEYILQNLMTDLVWEAVRGRRNSGMIQRCLITLYLIDLFMHLPILLEYIFLPLSWLNTYGPSAGKGKWVAISDTLQIKHQPGFPFSWVCFIHFKNVAQFLLGRERLLPVFGRFWGFPFQSWWEKH